MTVVDNTFIRDVQITTGLTATVFLADDGREAAAVSAPRQNIIHRSTNGGATWNRPPTGAAFPGPGRRRAAYFAAHVSRPTGGTWAGATSRVGPSGIVHYVYAQHGAGAT